MSDDEDTHRQWLELMLAEIEERRRERQEAEAEQRAREPAGDAPQSK